MKVKHCMHGGKELVTIGREALLQEVGTLMKQHGIRHLPVVEDGQMVGFITESDIRHYAFPSMERDIQVLEVMVRNIITINVNATVEKAARLIHDYKIGGLPVMDKKRLVGIITATDLLSALISVMGLLKASTRIDRTAFGVSWNRAAEGGGAILGDEVEIVLNIQAIRQ